jgi:hypothetical protein
MAIFLIIVVALAALAIAVSLAFSYPPIMLISWTILFAGSIGEGIVGKSPVCLMVRSYNLASSGVVFFSFLAVTYGVFRLQTHYKGYYPGTPGIQVDVPGIISLFNRCKRGYEAFLLPSIGMITWGSYNLGYSFSTTYNSCPWTTLTELAWVIVHFLNIVASVGMSKRMGKKAEMMANPPTYSVQDQYRDAAADFAGEGTSEPKPANLLPSYDPTSEMKTEKLPTYSSQPV